MFCYDCASDKAICLVQQTKVLWSTEVDMGATPRTMWLYWREYAAGLVTDGILLIVLFIYTRLYMYMYYWTITESISQCLLTYEVYSNWKL